MYENNNKNKPVKVCLKAFAKNIDPYQPAQSAPADTCMCRIFSLSLKFLHVEGPFYIMINPLPRRQNLDSSKLKEFADNNFKFDKNGRKLSKRVENTVGKGEIARYEQFLLFPHCF